MGKVRATVVKQSKAAYERSDIIRNAVQQVNRAATAGFYLEAITLIESLLADRLESHLAFLMEKDIEFQTLGDLVHKLKRIPNLDLEYRELVLNEINSWRGKRNTAMHEMAKMPERNAVPFSEKYAATKAIYEEGEIIRKKLFRLDKKVKRKPQEKTFTREPEMS